MLHEEGLAPATIASHLSAVSFWHEVHEWRNPTKNIIVQKMLVGARKLHTPSALRTPVTLDIMRRLISAMGVLQWRTYTQTLYAAMFTMAFYAFLQVGEMTESPHMLTTTDCKLLDHSIHITFRSYKFSQGSCPTLIIPTANHDLCPHRRLREYLAIRCSTSAALFVDHTGRPVSAWGFTRDLDVLVHGASLTQYSIKPHSFRIGAATMAANSGIPHDTIQRMGRWSSGAFTRYIRQQINCL